MEKNFFDYYSYSFFNPFSNSRARINYSLLQLINNKMNLNNLQVTKDEIVDWIVDYLKDNDIEIFNDDESRVTDLRTFAYDKIRYFIASKWLIEEFEGIKTTYQMDEGAIQILNVMQNIMNEESKPLEFSGFVYSIYSLLKNFDYDHSVQMIEQIYDRSKTLNTMLRGLNVSIKKYLTKLIRENETKPKEILNTIYFEYQKKVVLKAFKNFRESDNPSKYKNKILSKIDELNESKNFNKLVNKYIEVKCDNIKNEENIEEATNFYNEAFDYLRNQFEEIESYIEMLNHKNSNYLRTAQSRVTFLLNEDTDVEGRITNSLKGIEKMDEEFFNDSLFDLFSNGNLDEYSLYNPVNKRSKMHPKELEDIEEYDLSEINEYFDKMLKENDLSVSKINEFVDNNLKDKNELLVSEFEVNEFIDLLKILCISIYSENSSTIYKIERMNTKFNKLGYKMDDFKVKKEIRMSSESKNLACANFNEKYKVLNDSKKNNFSRLCNKLLNENFIYFTENNPSDKNDYYAILELKDVIEDYFKLIDFELINVDTYKIFYLKTLADRNRIRLKKFETVILLILRLLYHKGRLNVNLSSDMKTTVLELTQEINKTGIFKNNFNKTDFINALKQLKRYKLIYFNFTDLNDDNVILIYPTILYVVTIEDINLLNEKINKYKALKGDEEDEISED